ncbi:monovalent cation/H(+) antiporter subunit G [Lentibacillus sp. CBA3610]|uniref:monovalent cation/H(+) antiporter subunit G n=1 Tax=Lentibacillus sp. CBA3610 TaxID=2518176 RepID=UPI0015954BEA|nr:monovalent cation/H(+) antiporter subunit G [Lentibacillus sp. CBA3610]QKY69527.1 Na+/H+ antiporter subunit G [Lentibacillus sp. CBA3610]
MSVTEVIVSIFLLIGAFFSLLGALGLIRLPDVYNRAHAAGKSSTFGVIFLILATFLFFLFTGEFNAKLLLAILFVFLTAPLSSLMVSRSAHRTDVPLYDKSIRDDLQETHKKKEKKQQKET